MNIKTNKHTASSSSIVTTNSTVVAASVIRTRAVVKNLGTTPLYVKKGTGCSNTSTTFTDILPGGQAQDDGYGGATEWENYTGAISIYSATTPRALVVIDTL